MTETAFVRSRNKIYIRGFSFYPYYGQIIEVDIHLKRIDQYS